MSKIKVAVVGVGNCVSFSWLAVQVESLKMPCCPSLTVKMQNQVAAALQTSYQQLKDALGDQGQLFMDESPTKQANQKAWLWTAVAPLFAVFAIFSSRKGDALPKLLDRYQSSSAQDGMNIDRSSMVPACPG